MYSSRALAQLTGITPKSLRHYERVGLLTPRRTVAGYRRYSLGDVARIHKTLALKSLGFRLQTIKEVFEGRAVDVIALRGRLVAERDRLTKTIDQLSHLPARANNAAALDAVVAEFTWDRAEALRQRHISDTPRPPDRVCESRRVAFHGLVNALETEPNSDRARALAEAFRSSGEPDLRTAVKHRAAWPTGMRTYIASLYDASVDMWERVLTFIETLPETCGEPTTATPPSVRKLPPTGLP
jgi:DNA-binding transcriptional MerR regulator